MMRFSNMRRFRNPKRETFTGQRVFTSYVLAIARFFPLINSGLPTMTFSAHSDNLQPRWRVWSGWSCATVAVLAFGMMFHLVSTDAAYGDRRNETDKKKTTKRQLWREGMRVELLGTFQGGGVEQITFRPQKGDQSFRVLENLALQRVAKVLAVNKRRLWQVTAEVTEFENSNFLLLRRVVVKGKLNSDGSSSSSETSN